MLPAMLQLMMPSGHRDTPVSVLAGDERAPPNRPRPALHTHDGLHLSNLGLAVS